MHLQPRCENFYLNRLFLAVSNRIIFRRTRLDVYYSRRIPSLRHMLQSRGKFQESVLAMHEVLKKKEHHLTFFAFSQWLRVALWKRWRFYLKEERKLFELTAYLEEGLMDPHARNFSLPLDIRDQKLFQIRNDLVNPRIDLSFLNA